MKKNISFYEKHYIRGELFMEFIKGSCLYSAGKLCEYCQLNKWVGEKMTSIPGAQIKKRFAKDEILTDDEENIAEFAQKYCVEEILVKKYLDHLQQLKVMEEIRSRSRKQEQKKRKEKTYDQYDWLKLAMDGGLKN